MFENKYPYTDFHELNLDWFLAQFKILHDDWEALKEDNENFKNAMEQSFATLDQTVQNFIQFVNDYFDNLDVQQEINNKLDQMAADGTLDAILLPYFNAYKAEINQTVSTQNQKIAVLEGRMDEFSSLTEGSTTGDAELMDIRVAADGEVYPTAGDAVRGQIEGLQAQFDMLAVINDPVRDLSDVPVSQGYLNATNGEFISTSGANMQRTTDFIELEKNVRFTLVCEIQDSDGEVVSSVPRVVCVYDADELYSRAIPIPSGLSVLELTGNETYIRINYNPDLVTNSLKTLEIYKNGENEKTISLKDDVLIPQLQNIMTRYIGARRCAIAFILDGEYDMNATFEQLFYSRGYRIGFAPQYTTNFPNNSKATYLAWQNKGHEILAHSSYILDGNHYDDATCKAYIKAAYETFTQYGFITNGLIGSSGKIADRYIDTVKMYFRYCASENNHSGSYPAPGSEPCLFFDTDAPFHLWRYSMQTSTLQQMKDAVDRAISETGLVLFYGHAKSDNTDYFTVNNITALLDYIETFGADIQIMTPNGAINMFYSIRYDDVVS